MLQLREQNEVLNNEEMLLEKLLLVTEGLEKQVHTIEEGFRVYGSAFSGLGVCVGCCVSPAF